MQETAWKLFVAYLATNLMCSDALVGAANIGPDVVHLLHVCKGTVFCMHVIAELLHRYGTRAATMLKQVGQIVRGWWL